MKVWSIKMRWHNATIDIATGYATEEEARDRIAEWRAKWRCLDQPFFVVPEDDGDEESQGITASSPDRGVIEDDDASTPVGKMFA